MDDFTGLVLMLFGDVGRAFVLLFVLVHLSEQLVEQGDFGGLPLRCILQLAFACRMFFEGFLKQCE